MDWVHALRIKNYTIIIIALFVLYIIQSIIKELKFCCKMIPFKLATSKKHHFSSPQSIYLAECSNEESALIN